MATVTSKSAGSYKAGTQVTWRDNWSQELSYLINDAVMFAGQAYVAVRNNENSSPAFGQAWALLGSSNAVTQTMELTAIRRLAEDAKTPRFESDNQQ